jgi:hypothetical protein
MAGRDYVLCADCGVKIFYDGGQTIRDHLELRWGDSKAPDFTVRMVCPDCLKKLEDKNKVMTSLLECWRNPMLTGDWRISYETLTELLSATNKVLEKTP